MEKPFLCMLCPKRFAFKSSMQSHVRGHQNGTSGPDDDTDDIECIKEQMKMQDYGRQLLECEQALSDQDQSLSPHSQDYNTPHTPLATHNNTDNDISKLNTDSRQTLAMLQ